jgi:hypothetical protein
MLNLFARVAAAACAFALLVAAARDPEFENAQTAGQIEKRREQACKDLKGAARENCLNGYVGPEGGSRYGRDSVYSGTRSGSNPAVPKRQGEWTKPKPGRQ